MTNASTIKKVSIASLIMMASVFASRLIGVFREMAIAGIGGVQASVDAYQIAFVIPEILNHVVAAGFLSITFIPIFSKYLSQNNPDKGWRVFSLIMNTFGLVLLLLIILAIVFAPYLVKTFALGIEDPVTFDLAVRMTRIIIPAQFFVFSGSLLMAVQFAHEKFFIPALAPLIYNLLIIAGGLLLSSTLGMEGFAWGVLTGSFLGHFALQIWGTRSLGIKYKLIIGFNDPDVVTYIKLTLPLMLGITMTFSTEILLKFFGSFLPPGSIAALNYSLRVMFTLVGFFGQAVGIASYPYLAQLAAKNNFTELNALLNTTLKFIFLVLPISTFFMAGGHEIVLLLFQRGAFDSQATALTAGILPFFMVGAFAFSAQSIVSRGFYAMQNTLFPTILTTLCVIFSIPFIYLLTAHLGAKGLASGICVSVIIQCLVLYESWNRKSQNMDKNSVYLFFLKMLPVSLITGIPLHYTAMWLRTIEFTSPVIHAITILVVLSSEFVLIFYSAGVLFKLEEVHTFTNRIVTRIIPWKKKSN